MSSNILHSKILDGESPRSFKRGILRGNGEEFVAVVSSGNVLRIEFKSDSTVTEGGFRALYQILNGEAKTFRVTKYFGEYRISG